jgi:hypothetical protein
LNLYKFLKVWILLESFKLNRMVNGKWYCVFGPNLSWPNQMGRPSLAWGPEWGRGSLGPWWRWWQPTIYGLPLAKAGPGRRLEHTGGVGKSFWALEQRKTPRRRCSTVTDGRQKGNGSERLAKNSSMVRERSARCPGVRWYSGNQRRGQRAARAVRPRWSIRRQEKNSAMALGVESWQVVTRVEARGCSRDFGPLEARSSESGSVKSRKQMCCLLWR